MTAETVTRVLLVRHGETEWNVAGRHQGQADSALTARGVWQAERLAERLGRQPVDVLYSSDLGRCLATAEPVARAVGREVLPEAGLREQGFGEYEGYTFQELVERHGATVRRWADQYVDGAPPGGESLRAMQQRVADCLARLVARHSGQTLLLVAHGGSVRAAVMTVLGMEPAGYTRLRLDNASLSVVEFTAGRERLLSFNDTAHLGAADSLG